MADRSRAWTPDEIWLTMEAHLRIQGGEDAKTVTADLAVELRREESAVDQAIRAVGGHRQQNRVLAALRPLVDDDPGEIHRRAQYIRALWAELRGAASPTAPTP